MNMQTYRPWALLMAFISMAIISGCRREEPIRTYRIAKDADEPDPQTAPSLQARPPSTEPGAAAPDRVPTDRMLAAILTDGDRVWTLKLTGPIAQVGHHASAFDAILRSLDIGDAESPTWQLPEGWERLPASGMRFATLVPGTANKNVDFSVIVLPAPQDVLANVNRWRGQMQLPAVTEDDLAAVTRQVATASGQDATVIDIEGRMQAGMAPFAGSGPPIPPPAAVRATATESPVRFTAPRDWAVRPTRMSQVHVFEVADEDRTAEVSIAVLGLAGGDLLPNINRWRSQLGMDPWAAEELDSALSDRQIAGMDAKWVELVPENADLQRATIGAIGYRDDSAWFFKITGDKDLVLRERDRFDAFLRSIEFTSN